MRVAEVSKTTDGALSILEFLGDQGSVSIADVARELDLSRTVAYRLLSTLEARSFVRRNDGIYRLGPKLFALAQHVEWAVRDAADPFMARLVESLKETVVLAVRDGLETLSVHRLVSRERIVQVSYPPGLRHPLTATAGGKVMLAYAEPEDRRRVIGPGGKALENELAKIRRRGYASGVDELQPGMSALAAPISSVDGVAASVVVYTPTDRDRVDAMMSAKDAVLDAARQISSQLTN